MGKLLNVGGARRGVGASANYFVLRFGARCAKRLPQRCGCDFSPNEPLPDTDRSGIQLPPASHFWCFDEFPLVRN
jgi:hypothetical protein